MLHSIFTDAISRLNIGRFYDLVVKIQHFIGLACDDQSQIIPSTPAPLDSSSSNSAKLTKRLTQATNVLGRIVSIKATMARIALTLQKEQCPDSCPHCGKQLRSSTRAIHNPQSEIDSYSALRTPHSALSPASLRSLSSFPSFPSFTNAEPKPLSPFRFTEPDFAQSIRAVPSLPGLGGLGNPSSCPTIHPDKLTAYTEKTLHLAEKLVGMSPVSPDRAIPAWANGPGPHDARPTNDRREAPPAPAAPAEAPAQADSSNPSDPSDPSDSPHSGPTDRDIPAWANGPGTDPRREAPPAPAAAAEAPAQADSSDSSDPSDPSDSDPNSSSASSASSAVKTSSPSSCPFVVKNSSLFPEIPNPQSNISSPCLGVSVVKNSSSLPEIQNPQSEITPQPRAYARSLIDTIHSLLPDAQLSEPLHAQILARLSAFESALNNSPPDTS